MSMSESCPVIGTGQWTYMGENQATSRNVAAAAASLAKAMECMAVDASDYVQREPDTFAPIDDEVRTAATVALMSLSQSTVHYTFLDPILDSLLYSNETFTPEPNYAMQMVEGGAKYYWVNMDIFESDGDLECIGSLEATIRVDETTKTAADAAGDKMSVVHWGPEQECFNLNKGEEVIPIDDMSSERAASAASFVSKSLPKNIDRYSFADAFRQTKKPYRVVPMDGAEKFLLNGEGSELTFDFVVVYDDSDECMGSFEASVHVDINGQVTSIANWGYEGICQE